MTTSICAPVGVLYDGDSPAECPMMAAPSGDLSLYTSRPVPSAASREPTRKVIRSPATVAVTTMPGSTTRSSASWVSHVTAVVSVTPRSSQSGRVRTAVGEGQWVTPGRRGSRRSVRGEVAPTPGSAKRRSYQSQVRQGRQRRPRFGPADLDRLTLSLIHISEPTRLGMISYAV